MGSSVAITLDDRITGIPWRLSRFSEAMILPFEIKEGAISGGPEITAGNYGSKVDRRPKESPHTLYVNREFLSRHAEYHKINIRCFYNRLFLSLLYHSVCLRVRVHVRVRACVCARV